MEQVLEGMKDLEQCKQDVLEAKIELECKAGEEIRKQIKYAIDETVHREYEKTNELADAEKLSDLKKDMNGLLESVQEKLQLELKKYSLEKEENVKRFNEEYEYKITEELIDMYKEIMKEAIVLLRSYGYENIVGEVTRDKMNFIHKQNGCQEQGPKPKNPELEKAQRNWFTACQIYSQKAGKIKDEEVREKQKRATEMWEQA